LRTDLSQSRAISVYDAAQVAEVTRQMQLPRGTRITFDVAREVATRRGLKAVLAGDISSLGNSYILSARLVATASGDVLWAGRETATADGLAAAVDRLSATLRERVGESLRSIRADPPLAQMTTASTEALRLFAQSERAADADDTEAAVALLERAIALDSNFAIAHRRLAVLIRNTGGDTTKVQSSARRAYALRDKLSARERYMVDAAYHTYVAHDTAKTVAAYRALLDLYPDDRTATNNLALIYSEQGKRREALDLYWRSIRNGTAGAVTFGNAIPLEAEIGSLDSARVIIDAFAATYPENPNVPLYRANYFAAVGKLDSARAILERRREATRGNARLQVNVLYSLLNIAVTRGRLDEAVALYRDARRSQLQAFPNAAEGLPAAEDIERSILGVRMDIARDILHDTAAAAGLLEQSISRWPPERRPSPRNYLQAARAFAGVNRAESARAYWKKWEAVAKDSARNNPSALVLSVRATIAEAEGRFADAVRDLQLAREKLPGCPPCFLLQIANVYDRAGQPDSAIAYIDRRLAIRSLGEGPRAEVYERLAQLYDRRGDKPRAVKAYRQVVELWKDADAVLRPRVKTAQARIASLEGRPAP
jgi:tetratricopeptide (TPR) repeat protein